MLQLAGEQTRGSRPCSWECRLPVKLSVPRSPHSGEGLDASMSVAPPCFRGANICQPASEGRYEGDLSRSAFSCGARTEVRRLSHCIYPQLHHLHDRPSTIRMSHLSAQPSTSTDGRRGGLRVGDAFRLAAKSMSSLRSSARSVSGASAANVDAVSSAATSILPSPSDEADEAHKMAASPPESDSEYRWHLLRHDNGHVWWRNVDNMANFILHWQNRFHQHGDMFGTCLVRRGTGPCKLGLGKLREAVRRLRFQHPTIALRLARRAEFGIAKLELPAFIEKHVDLQVALVYDGVQSDEDVERWLDQVVVVHNEERQEDGGEYAAFIAEATKDGVPGRDRLRIHFWPCDEGAGIDARLLVEQCHSVSEGIGTLLVFNHLLASVAGVLAEPSPQTLRWGEEVARLEPALQDAIEHPPPSWDVSRTELKQVERVNQERMNGKATPPTAVDKIAGKFVGLTLRSHQSRSSLRTKAVAPPLVKVCRAVAEKGDMLPLGLLPQTGKPFEGQRTHTAILTDTLDGDQTRQLLAVLKARGLTLAPFLEACGHMATTWTRKHRGLVAKPKSNRGYDEPDRILGSFSNAISKRDTLKPEYRSYLGLCMSGFPTKVAVAHATWTPQAEQSTTPSGTDPRDPLPNITRADLAQLLSLTHELAGQYTEGRNNANWLRYDKALMLSTMHTEYLLLRSDAHYPSMPWLSSVGRVDPFFLPAHPITPSDSLEVHSLRIVGRVAIRQPILHVFSFRSQTTLQLSYAEWLYPTPDPGQPQSILQFWLQTFRATILALLHNPPPPEPNPLAP